MGTNIAAHISSVPAQVCPRNRIHTAIPTDMSIAIRTYDVPGCSAKGTVSPDALRSAPRTSMPTSIANTIST